MSHVSSNTLKDSLKRTINAGANRKRAAESTFNNLVDSLYQVETAHANTTSGSGVVNLSVTQPANSYIEDIAVICTSAAAFDTAHIGTRVGTTVGGTQILNVSHSLTGSTTAMTVGTGTSTVAKTQLALKGEAVLDLTAGQAYTATARTIYTQVSASTDGFTNNSGEFTVAVSYIQL